MSVTVPPGAEYVAMGSSFGAGPGLTPRADGSPRLAGRSSVNYAHRFAETSGLVLRDVTYSGATTGDILNPSASGVSAQLDAVTADTRLVTITVGGNDIGYLGTLTLSSLPGILRNRSPNRRKVAEAIDPTTMDARMQQLQASLVTIVGRIHKRAPLSAVVIVDYLTILPRDTTIPRGRPGVAVAEWALDAATRLSQTFETAAAVAECEFLPVGVSSLDHHAWSAEPWTRRFHYSLRDGAPFHPTYSGMRAVAAQLGELVSVV
jgi:lysophospholipase L1-like esterase